ncbi:hypothetical protein L596_013423 [Steinernema carpocapsae]|uniref:Uncharacterized protein n=1 Tax=Steinernema carpocapsae TaxID=34508 RepID=A0A4U5P039_STECR|nr:hypothetical protein L596_013423 [Steinernema carpocapsae]
MIASLSSMNFIVSVFEAIFKRFYWFLLLKEKLGLIYCKFMQQSNKRFEFMVLLSAAGGRADLSFNYGGAHTFIFGRIDSL